MNDVEDRWLNDLLALSKQIEAQRKVWMDALLNGGGEPQRVASARLGRMKIFRRDLLATLRRGIEPEDAVFTRLRCTDFSVRRRKCASCNGVNMHHSTCQRHRVAASAARTS